MRPEVRSPKPEPGMMSMVLVPMPLMSLRIFWREPSPSATTDTTEAMPMMMPSMVSSVRILWPIMARTAICAASPKRPQAAAQLFFWCGTSVSSLTASSVLAPGLMRSDTMRPSLSSTMRWACAATPASCVTRMTVWPSACSSFRMFITSWPLAWSRAPVGSSARMTSPPFISARAMETRCCWPPESCPGLLPRRSARPSRVSSRRARS